MSRKKMIRCIQITTVLGKNILEKKTAMTFHKENHCLQDGHFTTKVMPSKLLNNQPSFERKSELSKIDNLGPIL